MRPGVRGAALCIGSLAWLFFGKASLADQVFPAGAALPTYQSYGDRAEFALIRRFYDVGYWRECTAGCRLINQDWGADALSSTLFFRWRTRSSPNLVRYFHSLESTARTYPPCEHACTQWSDVAEWDAVAAANAYEVTGDRSALAKAQAAYESVETSNADSLGACPQIRYQRPSGAGGGIKTLETEANAIRAGLLLYRFTGQSKYLRRSLGRYEAARRYFRDPHVPLYSVYVFDDGKRCRQLQHRFFASVNGLMIGNALMLWKATGNAAYREQALAAARAVTLYLSDELGIYENLQAENDIVEPLVESMYELAVRGVRFARTWIFKNAAAAITACGADGVCERFFGGPPPHRATVTAWQANGAFALLAAAAALNPRGRPRTADAWSHAQFVALSVKRLPATIHFFGTAIALVGTLGDVCCEAGHARVVVDGIETFDRTGIWQNKSSSGRRLPNTILFAWQWRLPREHTVAILPGDPNPKEGGSFIHLRGYIVGGRSKQRSNLARRAQRGVRLTYDKNRVWVTHAQHIGIKDANDRSRPHFTHGI